MIVIPAIDLIGHEVVRLTQGDFSQKTVYHQDPLAQARLFEDQGFTRLHVVDLEGARLGKTMHLDVLGQICRHTGLQVDFGGGVRSIRQVESILETGAIMISLGSLAVREPGEVASWIRQFGAEHFFIGADVLDGYIATHAWQKRSHLQVREFISRYRDLGVTHFFSTDVSRDGKLEGPAVGLYEQILQAFPDIRLIASGGVSRLADLEALSESGVAGVIVGKAIYEGHITLDELKIWQSW